MLNRIKLKEYSNNEFYEDLSQIYYELINKDKINTMLYLDIYDYLNHNHNSDIILYIDLCSEKESNNKYLVCYLPFILNKNEFFISSLFISMILKANKININEFIIVIYSREDKLVTY